METDDLGLGAILLWDRDENKIKLRLSIENGSFKISFLREDDEPFEAYFEDESDISDFITLLESCFDYT